MSRRLDPSLRHAHRWTNPSRGSYEKAMQLVRVPGELSTVLIANDARRITSHARDPRIARALLALHAGLTERWTVAKLARVAGLSRAAFARRFALEIGVPPLRHLAALRMQRAVEILRASDAPLAAVAAEIGYANEFALSRAFRRALGAPPSVFRRQLRQVTRATSVTGPRCLAA